MGSALVMTCCRAKVGASLLLRACTPRGWSPSGTPRPRPVAYCRDTPPALCRDPPRPPSTTEPHRAPSQSHGAHSRIGPPWDLPWDGGFLYHDTASFIFVTSTAPCALWQQRRLPLRDADARASSPPAACGMPACVADSQCERDTKKNRTIVPTRPHPSRHRTRFASVRLCTPRATAPTAKLRAGTGRRAVRGVLSGRTSSR